MRMVKKQIVIRRSGRRPRVAGEIDMHGLRVEDMLPRLDQYLSDAVLEGLEEVRIVHGHGTGALRTAIHARLQVLCLGHFRLGEPGQTPGGDGVTIVSFFRKERPSCR